MSSEYANILLIDKEDALRRLGGNEGLYGILLRKFTGNTYMEEYEKLYAEGNMTETAALAHTIKGLCANLSLQRLYAVAVDLDAAYKRGGETKELSETLKTVYAETMEAVQAFVG